MESSKIGPQSPLHFLPCQNLVVARKSREGKVGSGASLKFEEMQWKALHLLVDYSYVESPSPDLISKIKARKQHLLRCPFDFIKVQSY
jgi:hypothetical protein